MRMFKGVTALALVAAVGASSAQAQTGVQFGLGGGVTVPIGDLADATKTGYHGLVTVGFEGPANFPVGFRLDGYFQRLGLDDDQFDQAFQTIAGTLNAVYNFKVSEMQKIRPYIIAGGGYYNSKVTQGTSTFDVGSEGDLGINGGLGINFVAGSLGLFLEGRAHHVFTDNASSTFIPVSLGVRFGGAGASSSGTM
jgi:hypothetical protein